MWVTLGKCQKWHLANLSKRIHKTHTYLKYLLTSSVCHVCYEPHPCTSGVNNFLSYFIGHSFHQVTITHKLQLFQHPIPEANSKSFFLKCYIYCSIYICLCSLFMKLNYHFICLSSFFLCVTDEVFKYHVTSPIFFTKALWCFLVLFCTEK